MAVLTPVAKMQFIDAAGVPLAGGLLYTYAAGTTTPQATYTDVSGGQANSNPIILDSRGEAGIWLGSSTYKFRLCDANNTEIWTVDYVSAPTSSLSPVLSGNVTIDSDSSGPALKITQTGTGPVLRVQDSVDPDVTPFIIDSSGNVGIGTQDPSASLDIDNGSIQLSSSGSPRTTISADVSNSTFAASGARGLILSTAGSTRVTVSGAGVTTLAGQLVVAAGGASITGNSSVTGTLTSSSLLTVSSGGASITGDTTVVGTLTATAINGPWANIPSGTVMLFVQTTAPTGWTKSTTHNDKALRVVSGAASSGGSVAFTTAFASQAVSGTVASYTLTTSDIPSHSHSASSSSSSSTSISDPGHYHNYNYTYARRLGDGSGSSYWINEPVAVPTSTNTTGITASTTTSTSTSIGATGGGGGHSHGFTGTAINLAVQYVDVIIATKD
jgi:hypothetical protein